MKSKHLKIFSYLTKSYALQKEELEASRGILVVDLLINKEKLEDIETADIAKDLIFQYNTSISIMSY